MVDFSPPQCCQQLVGTCVARTAIRRRGQMQHAVGKAGQPGQAGTVVKVSGQGDGASCAPARHLRRIAQQGIDTKTAKQPRQGAPGNIATADNQ